METPNMITPAPDQQPIVPVKSGGFFTAKRILIFVLIVALIGGAYYFLGEGKLFKGLGIPTKPLTEQEKTEEIAEKIAKEEAVAETPAQEFLPSEAFKTMGDLQQVSEVEKSATEQITKLTQEKIALAEQEGIPKKEESAPTIEESKLPIDDAAELTKQAGIIAAAVEQVRKCKELQDQLDSIGSSFTGKELNANQIIKDFESKLSEAEKIEGCNVLKYKQSVVSLKAKKACNDGLAALENAIKRKDKEQAQAEYGKIQKLIIECPILGPLKGQYEELTAQIAPDNTKCIEKNSEFTTALSNKDILTLKSMYNNLKGNCSVDNEKKYLDKVASACGESSDILSKAKEKTEATENWYKIFTELSCKDTSGIVAKYTKLPVTKTDTNTGVDIDIDTGSSGDGGPKIDCDNDKISKLTSAIDIALWNKNQATISTATFLLDKTNSECKIPQYVKTYYNSLFQEYTGGGGGGGGSGGVITDNCPTLTTALNQAIDSKNLTSAKSIYNTIKITAPTCLTLTLESKYLALDSCDAEIKKFESAIEAKDEDKVTEKYNNLVELGCAISSTLKSKYLALAQAAEEETGAEEEIIEETGALPEAKAGAKLPAWGEEGEWEKIAEGKTAEEKSAEIASKQASKTGMLKTLAGTALKGTKAAASSGVKKSAATGPEVLIYFPLMAMAGYIASRFRKK